MGFEPTTSTLARLHSTTELFPRGPDDVRERPAARQPPPSPSRKDLWGRGSNCRAMRESVGPPANPSSATARNFVDDVDDEHATTTIRPHGRHDVRAGAHP